MGSGFFGLHIRCQAIGRLDFQDCAVSLGAALVIFVPGRKTEYRLWGIHINLFCGVDVEILGYGWLPFVSSVVNDALQLGNLLHKLAGFGCGISLSFAETLMRSQMSMSQ